LASRDWPESPGIAASSARRGRLSAEARTNTRKKRPRGRPSARPFHTPRPLFGVLSTDFTGLSVDLYRVRGGMLEVKHRVQRAGKLVERLIAQSAETPIVLDKAQYGSQVGQRVVDEIDPGIR
jgi:hypothetical protein